MIIDSSVWIAYFDTNDSQHTSAKQTLETRTTAVIIPEYILLEVVTVLRNKKKESVLKQFIDLATKRGTYLAADTLGVEVAACYSQKQYQKLSFVDVALVLLSKQYEIITFDKALTEVINQS